LLQNGVVIRGFHHTTSWCKPTEFIDVLTQKTKHHNRPNRNFAQCT